jgi:phosphoribosylglycinamide formyltransferase-1
MRRIAIFASGGGSNARKIMERFQHHPDIRVALVVSNKRDAGVLAIAAEFGVDTLVINRLYFYETEALLGELRARAVDFVVLAGFLWLAPAYLVAAYPRRILNIHPALLPKYGGKGMYGRHVHEAVKAAGETETGMTIHYVNERYDEGNILFQATCPVLPEDTPETIAHNVLALEHRYYPEVVERLVNELPG